MQVWTSNVNTLYIVFPIIVDTKNSPTKDLMLLALKIIEHVVSNQDAMKPSVNLSLYIIEVIFFFNIVQISINNFY